MILERTPVACAGDLDEAVDVAYLLVGPLGPRDVGGIGLSYLEKQGLVK